MNKNQTLKWKKGIFKCNFKIFSNGQSVGNLKDSEFSRTALGQLNDKHFKFVTRGSFAPRTRILDGANNLVGQISYSCWYPKAKIELGNNVSTWKFSNLWETNSKIIDHNGTNTRFSGFEHKGSIRFNQMDEALVLAGLYVSNYYWRMAAIIVAVIMPMLFYIS